MTRVLFTLLCALALASPVNAQQSGASCAAIVADAERLACYDALFRGQEVPQAGSEVRLQSEQLIPAQPSGRERAEMIVSCVAGELRLDFSFARQVLANVSDNAPVSLQVDLGGNTVRNLPVANNNTTVGFATTSDTLAFLNTLEGANSLKVRITPVRQRSLVVDFRLRDQGSAIAALRDSCS